MGIKRAVVNELTVSVLVMSSLSTHQSGHTFGLDIRETGGSVSWLLEGPGGPGQLLGRLGSLLVE